MPALEATRGSVDNRIEWHHEEDVVINEAGHRGDKRATPPVSMVFETQSHKGEKTFPDPEPHVCPTHKHQHYDDACNFCDHMPAAKPKHVDETFRESQEAHVSDISSDSRGSHSQATYNLEAHRTIAGITDIDADRTAHRADVSDLSYVGRGRDSEVPSNVSVMQFDTSMMRPVRKPKVTRVRGEDAGPFDHGVDASDMDDGENAWEAAMAGA